MTPLFIDLETQSACDLKTGGGWNYAHHPSTKLLTVSWAVDGQFHVWFPQLTNREDLSESLIVTHLPDTPLYFGHEVPYDLRRHTARPWVGHNAWTFDQIVWEALTPADCQPVEWGDTYPLALAAGLPGGLDAIGKRLWGEGKYEAGSQVAKKATRTTAFAKPGEQVMVAKYNVQDVRLLTWLWDEITRSLRMPAAEKQVLRLHRDINARGARVDVDLLNALDRLSVDCRTHAVEEIRLLTGGDLKDLTDLRSRARVFEWIDRMGVKLGTSLRKEVVQRYIEKHAADEERPDDDPEAADGSVTRGLPLVLKVLELRMAAMRITDAKIAAALQSVSEDERIRGLYAYYGSHTGRWAGRRLQVHNLPRPKEGVDVWRLLLAYELDGRLDYEWVRGTLPDRRFLTVDDAASALIRSVFLGPLCVADLMQIEARVIAWLAGESWLLDTFWKDEDPYMKMAARIFGPVETWPKTGDKKHPYRQVGKVVELGALYQLGGTKMALYAAAQGVDLEAAGTTGQKCIDGFRAAHPAIAGLPAGEYNGRTYYRGGFWGNLNTAALACCEGKGPQQVGRLTFVRQGGHLVMVLPSGRRLVYRDARVEKVRHKVIDKDVEAVVYNSPRFGRTVGYGGKWAENSTQAVARDFLAHGLCRLAARGIYTPLHVHDEAGGEGTRLHDFMAGTTEPPEWAPDFPLDAEGALLPRYAKSPPPGVKEVVYRNGRPHK